MAKHGVQKKMIPTHKIYALRKLKHELKMAPCGAIQFFVTISFSHASLFFFHPLFSKVSF
jgi:hypothetical protein